MPAFLFRPVLLGAALLSMAACSTYTDALTEGRPAGQVGTLEQPNAVHSGIVVDRIDGHWIGGHPHETYLLSPGEHTFSIRANVPFYSSNEQVAYFDVAPGGHYRLTSMTAPTDGAWGFNVVDVATGERVDRVWSNGSPKPSH